MPNQRLFALGGVMNNRKETPLTRSSCCSSAIGQSPAPSCPPDICCSRWRKSPPSASSCSTAPWNRPVMCHQQPDCQNKNVSYFSAENTLNFWIISTTVWSVLRKRCTPAPPQHNCSITCSRVILRLFRELQHRVPVHTMRYCVLNVISTWFAQKWVYLELSPVSSRGTCQLFWIKPRSRRIPARELLMIKTCSLGVRGWKSIKNKVNLE